MAIKVQDKMSWVPIRIEMKFDDTSLSVGTAFMFLHAGKSYLVTNWHNVTGRDSNSLEPLSPYSAIPNKLVLPIPIARETMEQGEMIGWESRELSLYNDDNSIW